MLEIGASFITAQASAAPGELLNLALNAGAALYLAEKVDYIANGVELSFELMNNGMAADKLASYVRVSNS